MIRDYLLAALNVAVAGLPVLAMFDLYLYLYSLAFMTLLILLLCWNVIGEFIIVHFAFQAHKISQNTVTAPMLRDYLSDIDVREKLSRKGNVIYCTGSQIAFFLPISKRRIVISNALERAMLSYGGMLLRLGVPIETYKWSWMLGRRVLLLAICMISLMFRLMELLAFLIAVVVCLIFSIAMLIVTGAIFKGPKEMRDAVSLGRLLGKVALKINDCHSFWMDKLIDFLMRLTRAYSFTLLQTETMVL